MPCAGGLLKPQPQIHRVGRLFVVVQKQETVVEVLLVQGNTFLAKDFKHHSEMVKDVGQRDAIGKLDAVRNSETVGPDSELRVFASFGDDRSVGNIETSQYLGTGGMHFKERLHGVEDGGKAMGQLSQHFLGLLDGLVDVELERLRVSVKLGCQQGGSIDVSLGLHQKVIQGNQGNLGGVEGSIVDGVRRDVHACKVQRSCAQEI